MQLQKYTFEQKFKPDKEMVFADTLLCAYIQSDPTDNRLEEELTCAVHSVVEKTLITDTRFDN